MEEEKKGAEERNSGTDVSASRKREGGDGRGKGDPMTKLREVLRGEKLWLLVAGVVLVSAVTLTVPTLRGSREEKGMAPAEVKSRVTKYVEKSVGGNSDFTVASPREAEDREGLYELEIKIRGQKFASYVTKDGELLFPQAINLNDFLASLKKAETNKKAASDSAGTPEVQKVERPDVKLFVMSYCPYGLQAEKGILPAWNLLKGKADIGIYFVDYAMHEKKELDENLRQYCLQEREPDRYLSYLDCFTQSGKSGSCLKQVGANRSRISSCVEEMDNKFGVSEGYENKQEWMNGKYPPFEVHADLNEKYGVRGSPTLVVNGSKLNLSDRSPEGFKKVICKAFTEQPEQCGRTLSGKTPSPGLGGGTTSSGSGGGCGG